MTEDPKPTVADKLLQPILNSGLEGLPDAIAMLINHAMLIEREEHLGASPYDNDDFEFLELQNIGERPMNLMGLRLTGGIRFDFPDNSDPALDLQPGQQGGRRTRRDAASLAHP